MTLLWYALGIGCAACLWPCMVRICGRVLREKSE